MKQILYSTIPPGTSPGLMVPAGSDATCWRCPELRGPEVCRAQKSFPRRTAAKTSNPFLLFGEFKKTVVAPKTCTNQESAETQKLLLACSVGVVDERLTIGSDTHKHSRQIEPRFECGHVAEVLQCQIRSHFFVQEDVWW